MTMKQPGITEIVILLSMCLVGGSAASGATRRATWPRVSKPYKVTSYKYINGQQTFLAVDPNQADSAIDVPAAPGPPVVRIFCPPFVPNKIEVIAIWTQDEPGVTPNEVRQFPCADADNNFTWKWRCNKTQEFASTCCPQDPENQTWACCVDPDFELECDGSCPPEFDFPPDFVGPDPFDEEGTFTVPTVSQWGLIVMTTLLLVSGIVTLRRRKLESALL